MKRYQQILGWLTLTACLGFLVSQLAVKFRTGSPSQAAVNLAESVTGDEFEFSLTSPRGTKIYSVNRLSEEMVQAIDRGFETLFAVASSPPYNFSSALLHSDYTVFVAKPDRVVSKKGTYSPDVSVAAQQYRGSKYEENGRVPVAGMVLAFTPCAFVVAEHTKDFDRVASAVRHEGEHIVLYHNDRAFYERTADHSQGGGHPILKQPQPES